MLSYTTKTRLAEFLLAVNEGERQIEIVRQILCEQDAFEPYAAFKRIDRLKTGAINAVDILRFLEENKIQHSERNCHIFIQRYDNDNDGQLNYTEFLQAVLTVDNTILRTVTTQRPNYDVPADQYLPYDIEYSLSKLIDKEIHFYIDLDSQKKTLLEFHDFNYPAAFSVIDKYSTGSINFDNLRTFFKSQAIYPGDEEVIAILRRLDRNDDGLITFDEFVETIEPYSDILRATANRRNAGAKYTSPLQASARSQVNTASRKEASPLRKTASPLHRTASPSRVDGLTGVRVSSFEPRTASPQRIIASPYNNLASSYKKEASPYRKEASPYRREASPANRSPIDKLLHVSIPGREASPIRRVASPLITTQQGESPSRVGNNGLNSSLRRSQIYKDFSKTQSKSPVKTRNDDSFSASKLIDTFGRGREELRTPEKKSLQTTRQSSIKKTVKKNLNFDEDVSQYVLIQTLKQFIVLDKDIEVAKQDAALKSDFNLLDFFRTFDIRGHGSVTCKDFETGLVKYGVYPDRDELNMLFKKLDLDNDGLLKFSDFAETFTPKQKEYSNLLHNRTPSNVDAGNELYKLYSQDTKVKVVNMLKLHLENEGASESLRQRLKSKSELSGHEAFKYLDIQGDGFVTPDELVDVFQQNDSFLTEREVKLLMERLDNDRDGKISYYELLGEITPKCEQI